jgi:hypothetical protein
MYREVACMRKLKALFLALCFILAILVFNIPRINFGYGSGFVDEDNCNGYAKEQIETEYNNE